MNNSQLKNNIQQYPAPFWVLLGVTLVDQLGKWLLFPFFALYTTQKFGINMTQMGLVLATFFVAGMIGKIVAGAISDRFGRRRLILFGLIASAGTSLGMGLATNPDVFLLMVGLAGLMSNIGDPAQQAMIADLLPGEKQPAGYSAFRVIYNLATAVGPIVGGILAARSFFALFIFDAISSLIAGVIARIYLPETLPEPAKTEADGSILETLKGYRGITKDTRFVLFLVFTILMVLPYVQTYAPLSVFMRDIHGLSPNWYSYLLSVNAALVIFLQFWLTHKLKNIQPMLVLAGGTGLIGLGLLVYGFSTRFVFFLFGMILLTFGEMMVAPFAQALVAAYSPEKMRGRYVAAYGLTWSISNAVGPLLAGLVMDFINPVWIWYGAGLVAVFAVIGFLHLHRTPFTRPHETAGSEATWHVSVTQAGSGEEMDLQASPG